MTVPAATTAPAATSWDTLATPAELRRAIAGTATARTTATDGKAVIRRILNGVDDRLLVIAGPCSLHDRETALDYAGRLRDLAAQLSDDVFVVMRAYVEKPRTALGWEGLAVTPDPVGPPDPGRGFPLARAILADITALGVPIALEWLSTVGPAYLADLVSWGCIGARTVEAPTHRQLASVLDMPVGMKNRTDGAVDVAVNAVRVAAQSHAFPAVAADGSVALATTGGNPDCHIVLRGGTTGPNFHPAAVRDAVRMLAEAGLPRRLLVDASHGNSGKDHLRQAGVAREIGRQIAAGEGAIRGVLLESFLLAGRQDATSGRPLTRGRSITDACMGWPATVEVLTELASAARARRRATVAVPAPRPAPAGAGISPAAQAVALVQAGIFDEYVLYEHAGTWTVAGGSRATITMNARDIHVRHRDGEHRRAWRSRPLACLGAALAELPVPDWTAYGWVEFEMAHLMSGRRDLAGPGDLAHLIVPEAEVRIDATGATTTCADPRLADRIHDTLAGITAESAPPPTVMAIDIDGTWYRQAVADAVREIRRGAFQKVILSRTVPVPARIDFPRTYLVARAAHTPARSFLLDLGGRRALGFCPETVLEADAGGIVSTQPLAGTRSLGNGPGTDHRLRTELLADPKEVFEHIVSVKLAYDELSRVCRPGTVTVNDLMSVKPRGSVQHLGSRVRGELGPDRSAWDALDAVFPAVTASGIPKAAACEYLARTEPGRRGLYSGAVLRAAHDGSLDAGLVLRTLFEENGRRWLRAGAGIIAASRPDREYEETCEKLRSLAPYLVEADGDDGGGTAPNSAENRRWPTAASGLRHEPPKP
ncbi:salicylate synthase [Streptomyces sp. MN03-5084-2B]|nr:salicylate synthase [Streptomyces sp. MN03-5084-2B]